MKKPIVIHNEKELAEYLEKQAFNPDLPPFRFSKEMVEQSKFKIPEKGEVAEK